MYANIVVDIWIAELLVYYCIYNFGKLFKKFEWFPARSSLHVIQFSPMISEALFFNVISAV